MNNNTTPFAKVIWHYEDAECAIVNAIEQACLPVPDDAIIEKLAEQLADASRQSIEDRSVELGWEILDHYLEDILANYKKENSQ